MKVSVEFKFHSLRENPFSLLNCLLFSRLLSCEKQLQHCLRCTVSVQDLPDEKWHGDNNTCMLPSENQMLMKYK